MLYYSYNHWLYRVCEHCTTWTISNRLLTSEPHGLCGSNTNRDAKMQRRKTLHSSDYNPYLNHIGFACIANHMHAYMLASNLNLLLHYFALQIFGFGAAHSCWFVSNRFRTCLTKHNTHAARVPRYLSNLQRSPVRQAAAAARAVSGEQTCHNWNSIWRSRIRVQTRMRTRRFDMLRVCAL